jgi:phage shock protein E
VILAIQTVCRATAGTLSSEGAETLLANGGQLVDVRSPADFSRYSLPGAVNLPIDSLCYEYRQLNSQSPVIVYGSSEVRSAHAARLLAGKGFSSIYHLAAR